MFSQKRIHQLRQILFLSLCMLLVLGFVSAGNYDDPLDDPSPSFRLSFLAPIDAPIQIINSSLLTVPPALVIPLDVTILNEPESSKFLFSFEGYLINGQYTFSVLAKDRDDNENLFEETFDIDAPNMFMWITNPYLSHFPPQEQDVSVGSSVPYTMTMQTEFPSVCRIISNNPPFQYSMYDTFLAEFNEGSQGYTTIHDLLIADRVQAMSAGHYLIVPEFSQSNYEIFNTYAIMCKQEVLEGQEIIYSTKIFYIGYDLTGPIISGWFDPELQEDLSQIDNNNLFVSSDDLVVCDYDFTTNSYPEQQNTPGTIPSSIVGIENYLSSHQKVFDYHSQHNDFEEGIYSDYNVNISCQNLAGETADIIVPFAVNISRNLSVFLNETSYTSSNPELIFTTTKFARCYYNNELLGIDELKERHSLPLSNIEDGMHDVLIYCSTGYNNIWEEFTFFVDTLIPEDPVFIGEDYTCGIYLEVGLEEPNKPMSYTISLYNSTIAREDYLIYGPYQTTELVDSEYYFDATNYVLVESGKYYTWEVQGTDALGQNTTKVTKTVQANDGDEPICDHSAPTALVDVTTQATGFTIQLHCVDDESGCSDSFLYSYILEGMSCPETLSSEMFYTEQLEVTENGEFCYEIWDLARNPTSGQESIHVDLQLEIITPSMGIANSKIFNFSVVTDKNVVCAQGYLADVTPPEVSDWYNSLTEFTQTGEKNHSIIITADEITPGSTRDEDIAPWVIICNQNGLYHIFEGELGYDISPPVLTLNSVVNPIVDPAAMYSQLTVTSDDDVVCTYLENEVPAGFPDYDVQDDLAYAISHTVQVDYWNKPNAEYFQEVSCRNLAGNFVKKNMTVAVDLRNEVNIIFNNKAYSQSKSILFNVSTLQQADCTYRFDDSPTDHDFTTTGLYTHTDQLTLEEGEHDLAVFCEAKGSQDKGYAVTTITIDSKLPTLELVLPNESCSLTELRLSLLASGTGSPVDRYNYTLRNSTDLIISGEQENPNLKLDVDLVNGTVYSLRVFVFDKAGNFIFADGIILASSYDDLDCDTKAPQGDVDIEFSWEGNEITVSCEDDESGCTNSYSYVYSSNATCDSGFMANNYVDQPLNKSTTTTFCYKVYDKANNVDNGTAFLRYDAQCFNMIQDPDENGVDCGGPCIANCGTCNNNQLDPFEEEIDCGGVCATFRICGIPTNPPDPDPDLDPDPNPDNDASSRGCVNDYDCIEGYECSYGECEEKTTTTTTTTTTTEEEKSYLALILILIGILLIIGGIIYIYYSRKKKKEQEQLQQQAIYRQQQLNMLQQQASSQQTEKQKKRLASFKEKEAEGSEVHKQHQQERLDKRKSLLETFKLEDSKKDEPKKEDIFSKPKKETKIESKKNKKLDAGSTEEYVDVRDLGKKSKPQDESLLVEKKKEKSEIESTFSKLSKLGKQKKETLKESSSITKQKTKQHSFAALEKMIAGSKNSATSKQMLGKEKVSSKDLVDLLTQNAIGEKTLHTETIISILTFLVNQKKISKAIVKDILQELHEKKLISTKQSDEILLKLS